MIYRVVGRAIEQRIHALVALGNVEVERLFPVLLGEDHFLDGNRVGPVFLDVVQVDQQQREAGQPLLPIHDLLFLFRVADDDGA